MKRYRGNEVGDDVRGKGKGEGWTGKKQKRRSL